MFTINNQSYYITNVYVNPLNYSIKKRLSRLANIAESFVLIAPQGLQGVSTDSTVNKVLTMSNHSKISLNILVLKKK